MKFFRDLTEWELQAQKQRDQHLPKISTSPKQNIKELSHEVSLHRRQKKDLQTR